MSTHVRIARQRAFTVVELALVVLLLGVIAALAAPALVHVGHEARLAKIQAVYGALRAATQVTYAAALVRGATGASGTVATRFGDVSTAYGYPDLSTSGIMRAAGFDATPTASSPTGNVDQLAIQSSSGMLTISPYHASTPEHCAVIYTPASAWAPPRVQLDAAPADC